MTPLSLTVWTSWTASTPSLVWAPLDRRSSRQEQPSALGPFGPTPAQHQLKLNTRLDLDDGLFEQKRP